MSAARYSQDVLEEFFGEMPRREAVSYSSYFLQRFDEAIQRLPPELREKIYKDYVAMKQRERAALGWNKVHEALLKKPFSELLEQIVPDRSCMRCGYGSFAGSSLLCWYCELHEINRHYTESWRGRLNKFASRIFERCIFGSTEAMTFLVNRGYSGLILTVLALRQHDMRQSRGR